jgi:hypothetical protein
MKLRHFAPAVLLLLAACNSPLFGSGQEDDLREQRRNWVRLGISDYSYDFQRACFCGGPLRPLRQAPPFLPANWAGTINDVFTELQRLFDQGADEINLDFDDDFHFPSRAEIDRVRNAIDDELTLHLSNFQPLR